MTKRVALYMRYSSDMQNPKSIEDQLQMCKELAERMGWKVVKPYSDAAISGASLHRPGIQALLQDAQQGEFDLVLTEALDRLSRDQEDIAAIYKRLRFYDIAIETLTDGNITTMHIGIKGMFSAMQLEDLANKTRRGLRGVALRGLSAGGKAFGYNVIKRFDAHGQPIKGEREINEDEAHIVRQIFEYYAFDNMSPKAIAAKFNAARIRGPSGKAFGPSTIYGNRRRGTGIINNELYIGKQVWNRLSYRKDPATGKRVSRLNDEREWVIQDVPKLRIVSDELWQAVKARQKTLDNKILSQTNRPRYLLSGLMKCGECGSGFSKLNQTHYGCSTSYNKGETECSNRNHIRRDTIEGIILSALEKNLMQVDLVNVFCQEYSKHYSKLQAIQKNTANKAAVEFETLKKQKDNIVQAIKDGISAEVVKDELAKITNKLAELKCQQQPKTEPKKPFIHSGLAALYVHKVKGLTRAFEKNNAEPGVRERIRTLIDNITLSPANNALGLKIDLFGNIAALFALTNEDKKDMKTQKRERPASNDLTFLDSNGCGSRI